MILCPGLLRVVQSCSVFSDSDPSKQACQAGTNLCSNVSDTESCAAHSSVVAADLARGEP